MNFTSIESQYQQDIDAVIQYQNEVYDTMFSKEFSEVKRLSDMIKKSGYKSPSDEILEIILMDVPLKMFDVAEKLNQLELTLQVLKLKLKEKKIELKHDEIARNMNSTMLSEFVSENTIEDELMISIYSKLIERVNSQISYSKELIMSAKKLWDRRKEAESAMPVAPVDPAAVPYDPNESKKRPIYGSTE